MKTHCPIISRYKKNPVLTSDLVYWGDSRVIKKPVPYHWNGMKIGPGPPPLKTNKGWLHIYHGVFNTMPGTVYRPGAALHARNVKKYTKY